MVNYQMFLPGVLFALQHGLTVSTVWAIFYKTVTKIIQQQVIEQCIILNFTSFFNKTSH